MEEVSVIQGLKMAYEQILQRAHDFLSPVSSSFGVLKVPGNL